MTIPEPTLAGPSRERGRQHGEELRYLALLDRVPVASGNSFLMSVGTMIFELANDQACHYAPGPLNTDQLVTYRMRSSGRAAT